VAAPAIPVLRVAEGVTVEASLTEIVQPMEVLRRELIVRELRVRQVVRGLPVCCGSRTERCTGASCAALSTRLRLAPPNGAF
jgi:hypothetical protein